MDAPDIAELNTLLTNIVVASRLKVVPSSTTDNPILLAKILLRVLRQEITVDGIKESSTNDDANRTIREAYIITVSRRVTFEQRHTHGFMDPFPPTQRQFRHSS